MCSPVNVASKRLTAWLSPLDATLTKNRGWGRSGAILPPSHLPYALPSSVSRKPIVCHSYENTRYVYQQFPSWHSSRCLPNLIPYSQSPIPSLLLHCSTHGTPTPRPTFSRRSPLARRNCARHPRFAAFHRAAPTGRSTLLDRNWFWTR